MIFKSLFVGQGKRTLSYAKAQSTRKPKVARNFAFQQCMRKTVVIKMDTTLKKTLETVLQHYFLSFFLDFLDNISYIDMQIFKQFVRVWRAKNQL